MQGQISGQPTGQVLSIAELNAVLKSEIEASLVGGKIMVRGEISNFTPHRSGHMYFSLKDESACIRAVMFRFSASKLRFNPENGMTVIASGSVSYYEQTGQVQLYVDRMQPDGIGDYYLAYEQLKKKLEKEGLFAEARKKALPKMPHKIALITSPTGAAVRDMLQVLSRRYPLAEVVVCPALVQGDSAPASLIKCLHYCERQQDISLILIGRGGGSIEDLWAFNDENLARAIARSNTPIISAVGHETDFTIADFVADRRAPTPSVAAEIAVPDVLELFRYLGHVEVSLYDSVLKKINRYKEKLERIARSRNFSPPYTFITIRETGLSAIEQRLFLSIKNHLSTQRHELATLEAKLETLNPWSVLSRGYAVLADFYGAPFSSATRVSPKDEITVTLKDGSLKCTVEEVTLKDSDAYGAKSS